MHFHALLHLQMLLQKITYYRIYPDNLVFPKRKITGFPTSVIEIPIIVEQNQEPERFWNRKLF